MSLFTTFPPNDSSFVSRLGQFQVMFPNGIEVSAVNHYASYTDGRDVTKGRTLRGFDELSCFATRTVEVMVSKDGDDGNFFQFDAVMGHLSPADYARLLAFVAVAPHDASMEGLGRVYRSLSNTCKLLEKG